METHARGTESSFAEADFIGLRDGFYPATIGANDFPYVQFRGGAPGFLKVLDSKTLAFADFRGNRQYISTGDLRENNRAALILMDYPNRQRLKIFARVEVVEAAAAPELIAKLENPDYQAKIERAFVLRVEAFDWNCPQHIAARFTIEEIKAMNQPLYERLERLEAENRSLQNRINRI